MFAKCSRRSRAHLAPSSRHPRTYLAQTSRKPRAHLAQTSHNTHAIPRAYFAHILAHNPQCKPLVQLGCEKWY